MSLFKQFKISIYKFHEYGQLVYNGAFKVAIYLIVFSFLCALITMTGFYRIYNMFGGVEGIFKDYVPEFSITDGKLSCDTIDKEAGGAIIYINTKEDFNFNDKIGSNYTYVIADSEGFVINNGVKETRGEFSSLGNLSKNDLKNFFSNKTVKIFILTIMIFSLLLGNIFMGIIAAMVLSLLGNLLNIGFVHTQITPGRMFKL
ncbi:MAG: DUF1189 family protein, partial [Lachnospirales bacterium]